MRLKEKDDLIHFLVDVNRLDLLESEEPVSEELFELFLKNRKPLVQKVKNYRKSQQSKQSWKARRFKHLSGIKRFHRSVRGKRMHRAMGRFLATRIFKGEALNLNDAHDALKAISSIRTHIYIEADYYMPLQEEVDFREFVDYAIPLLGHLEFSLFEDSEYVPLDDELELLLRLVDEHVLQEEVTEVIGTDFNLSELKQQKAVTVSEDYETFMLQTLRQLCG